MRASLLQKLKIIIVSLYATLRITFIALYCVYFKGGYKRGLGDEWLRWWAYKLLEALKITYTVSDPYRIAIDPGKSYIIMSNHRSLYDIPLIMLSLPGSIRMLTKKKLFKVPIWDRGLQAGEFISIDRFDLEQAKKDLQNARRKMESGVVLRIAPEGTRSRTGRPGSFKKGGSILAIESGANIILVGIKGSEAVLKPKTWDFFLGQTVEIHIGKPIDASRYTLDQKDQLLNAVQKEIAHLCGEE